MQAESLYSGNKTFSFVVGLETWRKLASDFTTKSACALWRVRDLLWHPCSRGHSWLFQANARPAAVFASLLEFGCQKSKPGVLSGGILLGSPWLPRFLQGITMVLVLQCPPSWFPLCGAPWHWPVPVPPGSDRGGGPAVPQDGGDPLPGGFLRRAPALRRHRLRHPSLAVAAAHCHPAHLLPPALLLVSPLSRYLCPKAPASPASQGLILREPGCSFLECTPGGSQQKGEGNRTPQQLNPSLYTSPDLVFEKQTT